jgi:hypothetical protein
MAISVTISFSRKMLHHEVELQPLFSVSVLVYRVAVIASAYN